MANVKVLERKQEVIDEIKNNVDNSNTVVFFEYHGLTVHEMVELRRKLKEANAELKVYKNTLVARALDSLKFDLKAELNGPKAMAYGADSITPIKVLNDFAKNHPALVLKVGIVDKTITDEKTLLKLAALPSKQELYAMLAGGLIATIKDLSICLDLYSQKIEN